MIGGVINPDEGYNGGQAPPSSIYNGGGDIKNNKYYK